MGLEFFKERKSVEPEVPQQEATVEVPTEQPATEEVPVVRPTISRRGEVEEIDVINLVNLNQTFKTLKGTEFQLFKNFSLDIKDFKDEGQFISLMGKSGCGKSQLLKIISGLQKPDSGEVLVYGKPISADHHIPMVFQDYSSFPWQTVLEHVMLPLKLKGVSDEEAEKRAREMIKIVGLEGNEDKWASTASLSGGQLQRVSIARALVDNSQFLLLDEATGALDIQMKREVQNTLLDIYYKAKLDPTILNVTHNIEEAVYLSNQIIILEPNPCHIKAVIDVYFDEPRTDAIRQTTQFADYVRQVEQVLASMD